MKCVLSRIVLYVTIVTSPLLIGCNSKRNNAKKALAEQKIIQESKAVAAENDNIAPEIKYPISEIKYEVGQNIDTDYILQAAKAMDNIDGDISKSVTITDNTIVDHKQGDYKITFSVSDKAGNIGTLTVPVHIISKYTQEEERRYSACIGAINKICQQLKSPSSFRMRYCSVNKDGSIVNLLYSADNTFGSSMKGGGTYYSGADYIVESDVELRVNLGYEYNMKEIDAFDEYYHPDSYVNRK